MTDQQKQTVLQPMEGDITTSLLPVQEHYTTCYAQGRLSGIVGFQVLNCIINRQVCNFMEFRYWELDRQKFIVAISVTLTLL